MSPLKTKKMALDIGVIQKGLKEDVARQTFLKSRVDVSGYRLAD
jgi:hypothetical protein